jgi:NaMN:DMB phosphoribosyltransferase
MSWRSERLVFMVTTAMVETILKGKASSIRLAHAHDVDIRVVDAGMVQPPRTWPSHSINPWQQNG